MPWPTSVISPPRDVMPAAAQLDLHSNSVKYRVGRAVARRGRPITEDRLEIELALLVCHWYGAPVLRPATA